MSFDLTVWESSRPQTPEEGLSVYRKVVQDDARGLAPSRRLKGMLAELEGRYPGLDRCKDGEVDKSPWTVGFGRRAEYEFFCIAGSKANTIVPLIIDLCDKHRLLCFDPQAGCFRNGPYRDRKAKRPPEVFMGLFEKENVLRPYLLALALVSVILFLLSHFYGKTWPISSLGADFLGWTCFVLFLLLSQITVRGTPRKKTPKRG